MKRPLFFLFVFLAAHPALAAPINTELKTTTPIEHVVVIFQENESFDRYFATYPKALNLPGEPPFHALRDTPSVNGLDGGLLSNNPNSATPWRLDRAHASICSQDHRYTAEQRAYDHGLLDKFMESTANRNKGCDPRQVMAYYDGNTVTALWNYAQHFAMSDNFFDTTFGPSTPGAIDLVSGQTHGATPKNYSYNGNIFVTGGTVIDDIDPAFDDCSSNGQTIEMSGKNIGDLLNKKGVTWGWFEGGFHRPAGWHTPDKPCILNFSRKGKILPDYMPHHEPFQYYKDTANPHHLPPVSARTVGRKDRANHQYGLRDFWAAIKAGNLPAVSFLKAPGYEDGHPGYSNPLVEQKFLVQTINKLQKTPFWKDMAIIILYDDSDGSYDHVMPPIINYSTGPADSLTGQGQCGTAVAGAYPGRCGHGPRLPLLIISPYAKVNFVDHSITDQTSIIRFIEDNWRLGRIGGGSFDERSGSLANMFDFRRSHPQRLILDAGTGELVRH